ncbi:MULTISPECIES: DUF5642 family protein [unclassified Rhodococcus (in: high G+C Gram-positive bacteria)]|uniref:DUF5642 family protein n=1 Tax=unclassified Rhodococcus (in: high G+C Gram-positive bacteria) TaxID=192944 RepID=UPI0011EF300A|nr:MULTISPECIES: DUF5642 family protein [unclassified Rhodococcus (in: high G+C Gram-positive bacteria)]KAA0926588.1 sensor domain-containing protein [Rhodococcus sp. ANT_H53B]MDI9924792.1 DUF5642 family protein [Rhodococcus sp. IEGM 1341]
MSPAARRTRLSIAVTSAASAALVLAGCSSTVTGSPEPSAGATTSSPQSGVDLNTLLIDPSSFPAPYDALVLPQQAISQAAPDLSGIPAGAEVSPAGCKPADQDFGPTGTAMIVGTDNDSRSTISIELTAVDEPLSARKEQLEQCGEVTATKSGATSTVTSTLTPAPTIDADDTLAVRQTVASGAGGDAVTQSMLTLMAQVDGVRVSATFMSFGSGTPDAMTLDELFTAAVQKVGQS